MGKLIAPLATLLLGLTACGTTEDEPSAVPLSQVPAKYAAALCDAYAACVGPLLDVYTPGEDCTVRTADVIEDEFRAVERAVEAGRIEYDGTKLQACLDEIQQRSCETLLEREPEACRDALRGTIEQGGDCSLSEECEGSQFCSFEQQCPGKCMPLQLSGGACQSDGQCDSGLVCSEATERCVEPAGPGDRCGGDEPECAPGYFCKGANEEQNTSGNCRTYEDVFAAGTGAACDILANDWCEPGLSCALQSISADFTLEATCVAKVSNGAACRVAVPDQCPADEFCELAPAAPPQVSFEGTCRPRPEPGQKCGVALPGDTEGSVCAAYARCDAGTCRALAGLGERCQSDGVCLSSRCVDGACVSNDSCE